MFPFRKFMAKFIRYCLQMRLSTVLFFLLARHTVRFLLNNYHGDTCRYPHIPRDQIEDMLYKKLNPSLAVDPATSECKYDLTGPSKPLHLYSIPYRFDEFLPTGIVNGSYWPRNCRPAFSVALVVPFRNRQQHLDRFLPYMHDFLRKQQIHYK